MSSSSSDLFSTMVATTSSFLSGSSSGIEFAEQAASVRKWVKFADLFVLFGVWYICFMGLVLTADAVRALLAGWCSNDRTEVTLEDIGEANVKDMQLRHRMEPAKLFGLSYAKADAFLQRVNSVCSSVIVVFWIMRSYTMSYPSWMPYIEMPMSIFFAFHFFFRCYRSRKNLTTFVTSPTEVIDAFAITAGVHGAYQSEYLNFAFMRFVSVFQCGPVQSFLNVAGFSDFKVQVVALIEQIVVVVIGFACTIFMFETLGELPFVESFQGIDPDTGEPYVWTMFNAVYFIFITLSTVGYGDMSPVTVIGRINIIIFVVVGIISFGEASSRLLDLITKNKAGLGRHRARFPFIVVTGVIDTDMLTDFLLEMYSKDRLLLNENNAAREIMVLVDGKESENGGDKISALRASVSHYPHADNMQFFLGSPLSEEDLHRVNAESDKCEGIFIVGASDCDTGDDIRQIFSSVSAKMFNRTAPVFLLLYSADNQSKLESMNSKASHGPDVVMFQERFEMTVLGMNCINRGYSTLLYHLIESRTEDLGSFEDQHDGNAHLAKISLLKQKLLNPNEEYLADWNKEYLVGAANELTMVKLLPKYCGKKYIDVVTEVYKQDLLLIGLIADGRVLFQPEWVPHLDDGVTTEANKAKWIFGLVICKHNYHALRIGTLLDQKFVRANCLVPPDQGLAELLREKRKQLHSKRRNSHSEVMSPERANQSSRAKLPTRAEAIAEVETKSNVPSSWEPTYLTNLPTDEKNVICRNHIILLMARTHFDALKFFVQPIRNREDFLMKERGVVDLKRQAIIVVTDAPLNDEEVVQLSNSLKTEENDLEEALYFHAGSPFKTSTFTEVYADCARNIVVAGTSFGASATQNAFEGSDLVFVLLNIRRIVKLAAPLQSLHVMSQVAHSNINRFLHDALYDDNQPLVRTTGFACGSVYPKNTARLALMSSFFSPAVGLVVASLSSEGRSQRNLTIHQIKISHFREAAEFKGQSWNDLVNFMAVEFGYGPLSLMRANVHNESTEKACCYRCEEGDTKLAGEMFRSAPVSYVIVSPERDLKLCDNDEVSFYDNGQCSVEHKDVLVKILQLHRQVLQSENVGPDPKKRFSTFHQLTAEEMEEMEEMAAAEAEEKKKIVEAKENNQTVTVHEAPAPAEVPGEVEMTYPGQVNTPTKQDLASATVAPAPEEN